MKIPVWVLSGLLFALLAGTGFVLKDNFAAKADIQSLKATTSLHNDELTKHENSADARFNKIDDHLTAFENKIDNITSILIKIEMRNHNGGTH